ncbi:hypothetical protein DIPPA_31473 [Diplonema papillatum]|nr:hypothetical protein DIPPA_31473 [Diplonema papillatum]
MQAGGGLACDYDASITGEKKRFCELADAVSLPALDRLLFLHNVFEQPPGEGISGRQRLKLALQLNTLLGRHKSDTIRVLKLIKAREAVFGRVCELVTLFADEIRRATPCNPEGEEAAAGAPQPKLAQARKAATACRDDGNPRRENPGAKKRLPEEEAEEGEAKKTPRRGGNLAEEEEGAEKEAANLPQARRVDGTQQKHRGAKKGLPEREEEVAKNTQRQVESPAEEEDEEKEAGNLPQARRVDGTQQKHRGAKKGLPEREEEVAKNTQRQVESPAEEEEEAEKQAGTLPQARRVGGNQREHRGAKKRPPEEEEGAKNTQRRGGNPTDEEGCNRREHRGAAKRPPEKEEKEDGAKNFSSQRQGANPAEEAAAAAAAASQPPPSALQVRALRELRSLQKRTLAVVEAVASWRRLLRRPFRFAFEAENYLLRVSRDCRHLDESSLGRGLNLRLAAFPLLSHVPSLSLFDADREPDASRSPAFTLRLRQAEASVRSEFDSQLSLFRELTTLSIDHRFIPLLRTPFIPSRGSVAINCDALSRRHAAVLRSCFAALTNPPPPAAGARLQDAQRRSVSRKHDSRNDGSCFSSDEGDDDSLAVATSP